MPDLALYNRAGDVVAHALVDEGFQTKHRWFFTQGYVKRYRRVGGKQEIVLLARQILGLKKWDPREVDHINRNKLDNRRCNLRVVTRNQNRQNVPAQAKSGFRGVYVDRAGRWYAQVRVGGKLNHLGTFDNEEEAARVASDFRREHLPYSYEGSD